METRAGGIPTQGGKLCVRIKKESRDRPRLQDRPKLTSSVIAHARGIRRKTANLNHKKSMKLFEKGEARAVPCFV